MANKLLTPEQAANGMLKIARQQIKEMRRDGLTETQIQSIMNAVFGSLMYGN
jgi:hypothetical protein